MSYQTSLNFAPAVPVRRNKPTPKQSRGSGGSKSKQSPGARPSSPEPEYDDGGNDDGHNKRSSANRGPRGPSQLDALNYSDSDEDNVATSGSKLKERRRAAAA